MVWINSTSAVALLTIALFGSFFTLGLGELAQVYDGLRVTWGPNTNDNYSITGYLDDLPKVENDLIISDWIEINNCTGKSYWRGKRYAKRYNTTTYQQTATLGVDYSVVLLVDNSGKVVGIQIGIPKNTDGFPSRIMKRFFIEDDRHYFSTVYFTRPEHICGPFERTNSTLLRDRTVVNSLMLQTGPNAKHFETLPVSIHNNTEWASTRCHPTLGTHYVKGVRADTDCTAYYPIFLVFNQTELVGFGWGLLARVSSTNYRFEYPELSNVTHLLPAVPNCLYNYDQRISTMHVFLKYNVTAIQCPTVPPAGRTTASG